MAENFVLDPKLEAGKHALGRYNDWSSSMDTWREGRARLDKRYFNFRDDIAVTDSTSSSSPRANIGVPLAAETVDTALARSYDTFFRTTPYGKVWGREASDQAKADAVQAVMDFQQQETNLPIIAQKVFRDAYKYGLGVAKLHYKREVSRFPVPTTIMGFQVGWHYEDKVVLETPVPEHVGIQDIFFPMDGGSVEEAEGIIHRTRHTYESLKLAKDGLGLPLYDEETLDKVNAEQSKSRKESDTTVNKQYETRKIDDGGLQKDDRIPILEYTGRLPGDIEEDLLPMYEGVQPGCDWIVTIVEGSSDPIRVEPLPYLSRHRMYIFARVIDDPGFIPGISIIEFVERLGLTIDELYNIVLDNMNFVINKQYYINELAGIDEADVVSSPGKVIRGKRPFNEAMGVIQTPDISQSIFIVLNMLLSHYKEYTGITNNALGVSDAGRQTATEIASIVRQSQTRLGQFERMLEDTFMKPLFRMWDAMNQQFLDAEFTMRVFKDGNVMYPKVAPEDIKGAFDFTFEGATRAESTALLTGQIMQLLQINATQPVPIFNPVYLGKKLTDIWGWSDSAQALNPAFAEQYMMHMKLQALQNIAETAKSLTPEQQRASKQSSSGNQGNTARPENSQPSKDFRSALAAVQEAALPQMPGES